MLFFGFPEVHVAVSSFLFDSEQIRLVTESGVGARWFENMLRRKT